MATTKNLDARIQAEEKRLAAEFAGSIGDERVRRCVAQARDRFADVGADHRPRPRSSRTTRGGSSKRN